MTGKKKQYARHPLSLIIITAVITLILGGVTAYFLGLLNTGQSTSNTDSIELDTPQESATPLWTCGMHPWIIAEEPGLCPICEMDLTPMKQDSSSADQESEERKILYWRAPMDPMEIYDAPGKSAMGMDLVPVYEDEVIGGVEVKIDPVTQQNMGIRTKTAQKIPLERTIRTYGHVTYDETRTTQINPKFNGWIEKVHVDFTGQFVKNGSPLFDIYSPELLTAQEEYLEVYKNIGRIKDNRSNDLLSSALKRLLYWDVPMDQIREIEKSGEAKKNITIRSPFSGVVTVNNAVDGGSVKAGTLLYRIADLSRVWVEAHIFEYELPWIELGQKTEMTLPYMPGKVFNGTVNYIYPYLQKKTRDVVIRLEFDNPNLELKPDMYADVRIKTSPKKEGIVVPSEAIIRSGERNIVFVTRGQGKFTPRQVTLGLSLDNGMTQILTGLANGEEVVTSGQFLLDSESKLKEAVQKMLEAKNEEKAQPEITQDEDDFFSDMDSNNSTPEKDDFFSDME